MSEEDNPAKNDVFEEDDWTHWTQFNLQGESEGEESTPTALVPDAVSQQGEGFSQGEAPTLTEMVPAAVPQQGEGFIQGEASALTQLASVAVSQSCYSMSSQPSTSSHETIGEFSSQPSNSSQHHDESILSIGEFSSQPSNSSQHHDESILSIGEFSSQPSTSSQLHDESILPLPALDEYLIDDLEDNSVDAEPLPCVDLLSKALSDVLSNAQSLSDEDDYTVFGASVQDALLQQIG